MHPVRFSAVEMVHILGKPHDIPDSRGYIASPKGRQWGEGFNITEGDRADFQNLPGVHPHRHLPDTDVWEYQMNEDGTHGPTLQPVHDHIHPGRFETSEQVDLALALLRRSNSSIPFRRLSEAAENARRELDTRG